MRRRTIPLAAVTAAALAALATACYQQTSLIHGDAAHDTPADSGGDSVTPDTVIPDSPCLAAHEPLFEGLDYREKVPADTPVALTIRHEAVMGAAAAYTMSGNKILVALSGYVCVCTPCPVGMPEAVATTLTLPGLGPGEYTIVIQGRNFPLVVVSGECLERTVSASTWNAACPEEARLGVPARLSFDATGQGCSCGGYVATSLAFGGTEDPPTSTLDITAVEVICDPSQCCEGCRCVDMYNVDVDVSFPGQGWYTSRVNGESFCSTMVFGPDGCSDWVSPWSSFVSVPSNVVSGAPLVVTLSAGTGYCCGEAVPSVVEERPGGRRVLLRPMMHVCEGTCCYMCDCIDRFEVTHSITGLDFGRWEICIVGGWEEQCASVMVYGLD